MTAGYILYGQDICEAIGAGAAARRKNYSDRRFASAHRCQERAEELLLPHLSAFARLSIARFALRHGIPARTGLSALRSAGGTELGGGRAESASAEARAVAPPRCYGQAATFAAGVPVS